MKIHRLNVEVFNSTHNYWHDYTVVSNMPVVISQAQTLFQGRNFRVSNRQDVIMGDLIYFGLNPETLAKDLSDLQTKIQSTAETLRELQANEAMAKSLLVDSIHRERGQYPPRSIVIGEYLVDFDRADEGNPPIFKIDYFTLQKVNQ